MGVLGLWQLLAPVGQPVALESLENKIFAVDISIWLNQALKGYRDSQGGSVANAHLLSLFSRLCKLLFYKIRPIIVFDGGFPELKKQTIINRQQRRAAVKQTSRDIGLKILTNYLASKNLAAVGGETSGKTIIRPKEKVRDEIFMLPPLPQNSLKEEESVDETDSIDWKFTNFSKEDIKYLNKIDFESDDFNNLPPDVKQEILSTLKESRKHRTWDQYEELPKESQEFSSYQMQCLLKKRSLSRKLEEVQKDMRQISSADFIAQYTSDHVVGETNKIMSDDVSHYVLLKKIIQKNEDSVKDKDSKNSSLVMLDTKNAFIKDLENIDVDDYQVSSIGLSQTDNCKNIKTEVIFQSDSLMEEDVDNPPKFNESGKSNVKEPKLSQKFLDDTLSSDDDELAIAIQMSMEQSNESKSKTDTSTSLIQKSINSNESVEILSVKSENADECTQKSTVILSSSDDELIPCEEKMEVSIESLSSSISDKTTVEVSSSLISTTATSNVESKDLNKKSLTAVSCSATVSKELSKTSADTNSQLYCDSSDKSELISDQKLNDEISSENVSILEHKKTSANGQSTDSYPSTSYAQPPSTSSELTEEEKAEMAQRNLQLQEDLESATALLEADKAKQDRQNRTVQEHMVEECKELLQLFGVPFIVSPTEAEAQCAFYDHQNLTHGTITDDSDVWLFGGKRVYKNFFTQQKYVEFYKDNEIFTHFGLSRKKLINFALLTGSDYTEGIDGVGPVMATEILSEFPKDDIEALYEFKEWWSRANQHAFPPENKVRAKLMKLVLAENFPDERIPDAYLNPAIDDSTEKFTWGRPDLDALRDYTRERFGWNKAKVDEAVLPVIKKLSERDTQTHIDSFFTVSLRKQTNLFPSKRIMSALKKLTSPQKGSNSEETTSKTAIKRKAKNSTKKAVPKKVPRTSKNSKKQAVKLSKPQGPVLSEESSDEA